MWWKSGQIPNVWGSSFWLEVESHSLKRERPALSLCSRHTLQCLSVKWAQQHPPHPIVSSRHGKWKAANSVPAQSWHFVLTAVLLPLTRLSACLSRSHSTVSSAAPATLRCLCDLCQPPPLDCKRQGETTHNLTAPCELLLVFIFHT